MINDIGSKAFGSYVMTKFCLLDQSVRSVGGHHLEYALRVLHAAKSEGLEPVLAVGREAKDLGPVAYPIHKIFRYSFWENLQPQDAGLLRQLKATPSRFVASLKDSLKRSFLALRYTRLGLAFARAVDAGGLQDPLLSLYSQDLGSVRTSFLLVFFFRVVLVAYKRVLGVSSRIRHVLLSLPAFVKIYRWVRGSLRFFLWFLFIPLAFVGGLFLLPLFVIVRFFRPQGSRSQMFAEDLARFVKQAKLQEGDHVFIPTLSDVEMQGVAHFCATSSLGSKLVWHLLFRRNLYNGRPATFSSQNDYIPLRRFRLALHQTLRACEGVDLRFYTDTDALTDQYNRLGLALFQTTPIPVSEGFWVRDERTHTQPLCCGYLGDARDEKGFGLLPDALDLLRRFSHSARDVVFLAQSNFNVPGGEPESALAYLSLQSQPESWRRLIKGPFESDVYEALFRDMDVALIPYAGHLYTARSSGVYAEALVAGIPAVVTEGSWMARLAEPLRQAYLSHVAQTFVNEKTLLASSHLSGEQLAKNGGRASQLRSLGEATHLLVTLSLRQFVPGEFLRLRTRFYDSQGHLLDEIWDGADQYTPQLRLFMLVPVGAVWADFDVQGLDYTTPIDVISIAAEAFSPPLNLPRFLGTVVCWQTAKGVAQAVEEIASHRDFYEKSAMQLAQAFRVYMSPACLVQHLVRGLQPETPSFEVGLQAAKAVFPLPRTQRSKKVRS